ncbi:MAG TPA: SMP-30/gluconolactonase/LRE family protein [Pyrinomonadaceae bacterium]|nr:SMP-30/gluconolactonase/LRE family protein [Pyrinomonadaceae bacterium]
MLAAALTPAVFAAPAPAARGANLLRPYGDVKVLATVPTPPGFPEGIAVKGNKAYVAGPARFGTTGTGPSHVFAFDTNTGALVRTYPTQGENLLAEHANSCVAFDGQGRLHVLNTQLGLYRIDTETGEQESYSTPFPDLKPCLEGVQGPPCSPTAADAPALPNDIAFDEAGNAYVTDSMQATIWRVPAGGGAPQIWFQDPRLDSPYVGVNGVRLSPDRSEVFLSVTTDLLGGAYIYTLPLTAAPQPADLSVFHQFTGADLPDGIAFGKSGNLYVTVATPLASGITVLRPDGTEAARLRNPALSPIFPYDSPANIAFNAHGSLLVTNHAFATGLPSQFTVLDVYVGDTASPLAKPLLP